MKTKFIIFSILSLLQMGCDKKAKTTDTTDSTATSTANPTPSPTASPSPSPSPEPTASPSPSPTPPKYVYVASGACYSGGGNTTFTSTTSSNLIYRIQLESGIKDLTLADYNSAPGNPGDSPVSLLPKNEREFYALIENGVTPGLRRIETIEKKSLGSRFFFSNNIQALSNTLRSFTHLVDGSFLISKSTSLEKITNANVRITKGTNPYVNAPGGVCATSTTLFSRSLSLNNGSLVFLHAATGQNRLGLVSSSGYSTLADCKTAVAAPAAAAFPTAMFYDSVNHRLIVSFAGNAMTTDVNSIYAYQVDEAANTLTNPQKIYDSALYPGTYPYLLYGISEMAFHSASSEVFVATAISNSTTAVNYAIERFSYKPENIGVDNSRVLQRVGATPFFPHAFDTKCISSMMVDL